MARRQIGRPGSGELIFPWKGLNAPLMPKVIAAGLLFGIFAAAMGLIRVKVAAGPQWVEDRASVIDLTRGGVAEKWARRAQEAGPFPSRVDPSDWESMSSLEAKIGDAFYNREFTYIPKLQEFAEIDSVPSIPMAKKGEPVFPRRALPKFTSPAEIPPLKPRLYPLVEIPLESMPKELPEFPGEISALMTRTAWRFLIRLEPTGGVSDSISLVGTSEADAKPLGKWLRELEFDPTFARDHEWIAVAVTFTNQR